MWKNYHILESEEQLAALLAQPSGQTRIVAGGTDLLVEIRNGKWPELDTVLDISRVAGLDQIRRDEDGTIHIRALVTHNDVLSSPILRQYANPLVQACWRVATPQIRNRATVVGNLATASPANDTIGPLLAMDASLVLVSQRGTRTVRLEDFYLGVRRTVLAADEYIREIVFKGLEAQQQGVFAKQALRKTQAISVLNCCVLLTQSEGFIQQARITLGSVAPTVIRALPAEQFLVGRSLTEAAVQEAARLAAQSAVPISDVRASREYRGYMTAVLVENALLQLLNGSPAEGLPQNPATLDTKECCQAVPEGDWDGEVIETTINGEHFTIPGYTDATLLNLVRDRVGLTGTKAGCEEGECGACTLFLDGKAVVSCLVPAPRAHRAKITTIEGIAVEGNLHPVQQAFIDHAAVQCGYCTPGFVMAAVKLLEEHPTPDREEIRQAISGNLCRCTGYYKIIEAIESVCVNAGRLS